MKDYFSHDYFARNDKELIKVLMKHKLEGIGLYWCLVEMLYEEGGFLLLNEYERITFELRTSYELLNSIINDFDLFKKDEKKFWSDSVLNRLNLRAEKSKKARQSIHKRWEKYERNTNVIRTKVKRNTNKVKESKVKESKVKESKVNNIVNDLFLKLKSYFPDSIKISNPESWRETLRLLIDIDKKPVDEIEKIVIWGRNDQFWSKNFLSLTKLRNKNKEGIMYYDVFNQQMKPKILRPTKLG